MKNFGRLLLIFACHFAFAQNELLERSLQSSFYDDQQVGFYLYDVDAQKEVFSYNGNSYFLPASNTKIATLYAVATVMKDSIPGIFYYETEDELHFQGTGDPTFLHPKFDNQRVLNFLKNSSKKLIYHAPTFEDSPFGNGWSWDDYASDYAPERSPFPIQENLVYFGRIGKTISASPNYFNNKVTSEKRNFARDFHQNMFYFDPNKSKVKIPYITSPELTQEILSAVVGKQVSLAFTEIPQNAKILYSQPWHAVAKYMMEESDNFLAEQLLLAASAERSKTIGSEKLISTLLKNELQNLSQPPRWNDGSGLSRYNLFSPKSLVQILDKLYQKLPEEALIDLMAVGGKSGTLKSRYQSKEAYIFGKTGTFSNTVTLSGYLKSNSGKTFIFSLMSNNSIRPLTQIRNEHEKLLNLIRTNY